VKHAQKRIQKLEMLLIRPGAVDRWGQLAAVSDDLIARVAPDCRAALRTELEELGPTGLWRKMARHFLAEHGFIQSERESLAETMARALDIGTEDLRVLISQGHIGNALLARFE